MGTSTLGFAATDGPAKAAFAKPDAIRFGASVKQIESSLAGHCKTARTRQIDPPFLDNVKVRQMQIDCDGFRFQNRSRHAEFVFGDDRLKMVWIMTSPAEARSLEKAMTGAYGPPNHRNKQYVGFTTARAALRLDRAEVLFYAADAEGDVLPDIESD
jgi:hypothetical protein